MNRNPLAHLFHFLNKSLFALFVAAVLGNMFFSPYSVEAASNPDGTVQTNGKMITIGRTISSTKMINSEIREALQDGIQTIIFDIQTGGQPEFGVCYELAKDIANVGGSVKRTVAFVDRPLKSHAVLIALACDEIVLSRNAKIGDVFDGLQVDPDEVQKTAYNVIAERKGHSAAMVQGMIDRNPILLQVTTPEGKRILTERQLEQLGDQIKVLNRRTLKNRGERLVLDSQSAKEFGLIKLTAENRIQVARDYGLPESITSEDNTRSAALKPVLLNIEGYINGKTVQFVQRRLSQAASKNHDWIFIEIDSTSGDRLACFSIAEMLNKWQGKKIAWINPSAKGPAILIALTCNEIVMKSDALLEGLKKEDLSEDELIPVMESFLQISQSDRCPKTILKAAINPAIEIVEVRSIANPGLRDFLSREELKDEQIAKLWKEIRLIKPADETLLLGADQAENVYVSTFQADTQEELRAIYDLDEEIPRLEATWMDSLIDILTSTPGTLTLIVLAFVFMYLEAHMPGFGVTGLLSLFCFALFFWSQFLTDKANALELIIFAMGIIFILVEFFVLPGFGLAGILGIVFIFSSLVMAMQTFTIPTSTMQTQEMLLNIGKILGSILIFVGIAISIARFLPSMPLVNRLMLKPEDGDDGWADRSDTMNRLENAQVVSEQLKQLIGKSGVASSPLRPSGRIRLDDGQYLDVVAEGSYIQSGTKVSVVQIDGNRIVVAPV